MARLRGLFTTQLLVIGILTGVGSAHAIENGLARLTHDAGQVARFGGSPTDCPKADTALAGDYRQTVTRISGALSIADQMSSAGMVMETPERVSVDRFCESIQTRLPGDTALPSRCKYYKSSLSLRTSDAIQTKDEARNSLFNQIKLNPDAGKLLVKFTRDALDNQYQKCIKAMGISAAPSVANLGQTSNPSHGVWQGDANKEVGNAASQVGNNGSGSMGNGSAGSGR